jgi:hypothetical protein
MRFAITEEVADAATPLQGGGSGGCVEAVGFAVGNLFSETLWCNQFHL